MLFAALLTLARPATPVTQEDVRFQVAVEAAPVAMIMVGPDSCITLVNRNAERLFLYDDGELLGQPLDVLIPSSVRPQHQQQFRHFFVEGGARRMGPGRDIVGMRKDGTQVALEIGLSSVDTQAGRCVIAAINDITELKLRTEALVEREMRYRGVIETTPDGFWLVNRDGQLVSVNEAYARMSGYSRDELLQMRIPDLEAKELPDETAAHIENIYKNGFDRFETIHRRKDGALWPAEITVSLMPTRNDMFVFVRDLTSIKELEAERARAEERIRELAFLDPLTELPNRRLLVERMKQVMAAARRHRRHSALLFIDMDHFKTLNDTLGHDMGDKLLIAVAQRLIACVRAGDTVARMGGDEFVVMLSGLAEDSAESAEQASRVGADILANLNQDYVLGEHIYHCTPSIGAVLFLDDTVPMESIFQRADSAMYRVKASGRNAMHLETHHSL